jgi:spore germination protein Q
MYLSYSYPYLDYRVYPQAYQSYGAGSGQPLSDFGAQQPGYGGQFPGYGAQLPGSQPGFPPTGAQQAYQSPPPATAAAQVPGMLPIEESYIENILRLNKGKLVTVYLTFENNREWNAKAVKGIIEAAGRDHLIISDPQTGMRYLFPMVYLDYVTFDEEIEYEYPYGTTSATTPLTSYPPR